MKTKTTLFVIAAAAALFGAAAFAEDTATTGTTTTPHPRRQMLRHEQSPEMKAYHEKVLAIYDADKNGKLDEDERDLLQEDIAAGKFERPPMPPGGRGPGGPGGPAHMGPPKEIVDQYDANKDGRLDDTERAALHADIEAGKIQMPHRGRGPGRPHGERPPPPPAEESTAAATTNT
jgi:hypothetical protein